MHKTAVRREWLAYCHLIDSKLAAATSHRYACARFTGRGVLSMPIRRRHLFLAALNIVSIVATGMVSELYLRATVFDPSRRYVLFPGWEVIERGSPEDTPGIDHESHFIVNRLGLRGDMPASDSSPKFLVLGSSMAMDILLDDQDTWAGQLQAHLRQHWPKAWVGNAGRAGTTVRHHASALKELLKHWPPYDRAIVMLGTADMLFDARIHKGDIDAQATWTDDQSFMYLPSHVWYERLALYRVASRAAARWRTKTDGSPAVGDLGKEMAIFKARRRSVHEEDWVTTAPDLTPELARFRTNVEALVRVGASQNIRLTLLTSPTPWKEHMTAAEIARLYAGGIALSSEWEKNPHVKWFAVETMLEMLERYNDVIRSICVERALACIDLDRTLPRSSNYFYDDFHFTKSGAAAVGKVLAQELVSADP
jgi:GDSL-like Lipase/Acylhydrolase family